MRLRKSGDLTKAMLLDKVMDKVININNIF
jgi:hypothetical protein